MIPQGCCAAVFAGILRAPAWSKKLIIAEKPSVAADIARALGGFTRKGDYFESDDYVLSSAVGHLLELTLPPEHDVKKGKWSFANLPVIPPHFDLRPIESSETRLNVLLRLHQAQGRDRHRQRLRRGPRRRADLPLHRAVREDEEADRAPVAAVDDAGARSATASTTLRKDRDLLPLADAAKCRSEADWLVGINGTRAMTAFNSKEGGFYLTTVGRVQTPTLAILVEREEKIRAFEPRDYWEVHARFGAKAGEYPGRWFDPAFKKDDDPERKPERIWTRRARRSDRRGLRRQAGNGRPRRPSPRRRLSPLLFDLTSLQREANGRFGFSAKGTLALAQALYERHKVLTYPRTDARALPEDYVATVKKTMDALAGMQGVRALRQAGAQGRLGEAEQAHLRQQQDLRPLRDHPDAADAQAT